MAFRYPSPEEKEILLFSVLLEKVLIREYLAEFGPFGTLATDNAGVISSINYSHCTENSAETEKKAIDGFLFQPQSILATQLQMRFPWIERFCERETFLKLLKASNFDLLSFLSYYASAFYRARLEVTERSTTGLDQPWIWARHSRLDTDGLCFNMKRKARKTENPILVPQKSAQVIHFLDAIRNLLSASEKSRIEMINLTEKEQRKGERYWWAALRTSSTWEGVSPTHRNTLYKFCIVIATVLENIFREPKRYYRLLAVHRKIPQTFLISSLYIINPAPFISKIIPMYTWKPSLGTWSLCQRMGSSLCGVSKTQKTLDSLNSKIDEKSKEKIILLCNSRNDLKSFEQNQVYISLLFENGLSNPSNELVEYLKTKIRMNEKMEFVNHLGDSGASPFLSMCSEVLPPLLNEISKVGTLHAVVSAFFDMLNKFWASLEKYHNKNLYLVPPTSEEMILELAEHFHKFVQFFYPMLYKIAMKSGTNEQLPTLTILFDCLFGSLLGWNRSPSTRFNLFSCLSDDEIQIAFDYIDTICELAVKNAKDESEWPFNAVIDEKLIPVALEGYLAFMNNF